MRITFKVKVQNLLAVSGELLYQFIVVPKLTRKHVDMAAARIHPKYGGLANSDLFESGVLTGIFLLVLFVGFCFSALTADPQEKTPDIW